MMALLRAMYAHPGHLDLCLGHSPESLIYIKYIILRSPVVRLDIQVVLFPV